MAPLLISGIKTLTPINASPLFESVTYPLSVYDSFSCEETGAKRRAKIKVKITLIEKKILNRLKYKMQSYQHNQKQNVYICYFYTKNDSKAIVR